MNCDKSQRWSISVLSFSLDNRQERNNRNSNFIFIFIYAAILVAMRMAAKMAAITKI